MSHSTRFARETDRAAAVVVSRQPILDNVERIVGFELLTPPEAHPHEATASVLAQAIADIGLQRLVGDAARARGRHARVPARRSRPLPLDARARRARDRGRRARRRRAARRAARGPRRGLPDRARRLPRRHRRGRAARPRRQRQDRRRRPLDEDAIETAVNARARARAGRDRRRRRRRATVYGFCRGLGFDAFQGQYFAEPVDRHRRLRADLPPARAVDARRGRRRRRSSSSSA